MAEPAVFFRAMPVFDVGGNRDDAALMQADGCFAFFLIPALTGGTDQELTAAFRGKVNMPVIAASGLKRHIGGK